MKKIILLSILFVHFISYSQTVLTGSDLPKVIKNDTVIIYGEVWVQTSRSEVKQRAEKKTCERKLSRAHTVLKHKIVVLKSIDSLLVTIETIEGERDSLIELFDGMTLNEASKAQSELNKYAQQLTDSNYNLWIYKKRLKKIRKKQLLLYVIIISEAVLIIVLI